MLDVNETVEPAHTVVLAVLMLIVGDALLLTLMVIALDETVDDVAHGMLLIKSQVTTSLLFKVVELNEDVVAPLTAVAFTYH
jgi:hypothetical protein